MISTTKTPSSQLWQSVLERAISGPRYAVRNPATGETLAEPADMSVTEADRCLQRAAAAGPQWRAYTAQQRATLLQRWFQRITEHSADLAALITAESGKPLAEAHAEVAYGAAFIDWFAEEGKRAYGEVIPTTDASKRMLTIRQPVGLCTAITPWNFPLAMISRKLAPALAAGCTMVVKPSEETPLTALALLGLAHEAGIPEDVFMVVTATDAAAIGRLFCHSPRVRKLSFTGSTQTGRLLLAQCAEGIKRISLELGGNAPFIVFDDADIAAAVAGAVASKFRNSGQTCVCANRFLVQEGVEQAFTQALSQAVSALVVGDGAVANSQLGPLINEAAVAKVEAHIADACAAGAEIVCGGQRHALGGGFFAPTVLRKVRSDMRIAQEETFGPVAPIFCFAQEAEAIAMANATEYGLAAYLYSRDTHRCWRVAEALEYGMVGLNEGIVSAVVAPFGGVKQSGLGREGGRQGLDEYLVTKYLCFGGF